MSGIKEKRSSQYPTYVYYLAGALLGAGFFLAFIFGSGAIIRNMMDEVQRCQFSDLSMIDSDECYRPIHNIFFILYPMSVAPSLWSRFLPYESEVINPAILCAVIGAICVGRLKFKRGLIAFLLVYLILSLPAIWLFWQSL